jgi:hypothetical protein
MPITISLLCDGMPNGGVCRASDVRPLIEEARAGGPGQTGGVYAAQYWRAMWQFGQSRGLTDEELEVLSFDKGSSYEDTTGSGFDLLSRC